MKIFKKSFFSVCLISLSLLLLLGSCTKEAPETLATMEEKLRTIAELPGFEHIYRDVVYYSEKETVMGIATTDNRLLFSINVRVQAGINLDRGFKIVPTDNTVTVYLPKAEILLIDADESSINQLFFVEQGKMGRAFSDKITRLEYYDEIENRKQDIRAEAESRGILSRAETNGRLVIRRLFEEAGYSEVRFETLDEGRPL